MPYSQLGEEIKKLREERGWTQEDLAEKAGLNPTHLGFIEQGRKEPRLKTLQKIASALNVQVRDLIPF